MNNIKIKAYGKINLSLDVLGRRENGYHDVSMIMQTVDLYDIITLTSIKDCSEIRLKSDTDSIPLDSGNIAYKAARLIKEEYKIEDGVEIHIEKHIPVAAGMGGGSADAAAVLRGMDKLFGLNIGTRRLEELGLRLGADVPFLISGGTALAEGVGERLKRLPAPPPCTVLLVKPSVSVSTKEVYEDFDSLAEAVHPDTRGLSELMGNIGLREMALLLGNVLEGVTLRKHKIIEEIKKDLIENGAVFSMMTGSGPTVFGLFETEEQAERAAGYFEGTKGIELVKAVGWLVAE